MNAGLMIELFADGRRFEIVNAIRVSDVCWFQINERLLRLDPIF